MEKGHILPRTFAEKRLTFQCAFHLFKHIPLLFDFRIYAMQDTLWLPRSWGQEVTSQKSKDSSKRIIFHLCLVSEDRVHMVVLFGGYSSNKDIFSSSIHVCSWEDITLSAKVSEHEPHTNSLVIRQYTCFFYLIGCMEKPTDYWKFTYRSLPVTNCDFYSMYHKKQFTWESNRHSACVVPSGNKKTREDLLVIHGGIGDGNTPLADINVLDFGSLAWSTLSNPADGSVPNPGYIVVDMQRTLSKLI